MEFVMTKTRFSAGKTDRALRRIEPEDEDRQSQLDDGKPGGRGVDKDMKDAERRVHEGAVDDTDFTPRR